MIEPIAPPAPRFLFALDPMVLSGTEALERARLVDRVCGVLPQGAFVLLSEHPTEIPGMPAPEYVVGPTGASIRRMPGDEPLADWPPEDQERDMMAAIEHLADALLISQSEVYVLTHRDKATRPPSAGHVVVVGGAGPTAFGSWVRGGDAMAVLDALERLPLMAQPGKVVGEMADVAYRMAVASLRRNVTEIGFTAASIPDNALLAHDANYAAVWARDGVITGLWTLCLDDPEVTACFGRTLALLARHQTPAGQIPANVRVTGDLPDYSGIGGIAAIDAVIWFVIGTVRYAFHQRDRDFALRMRPHLERAMAWLLAHDSNNDGLLEIPESSDWMDLFPRSYNVMLDEVLWQEACNDFASLLEAVGADGREWRDRAGTVRERILELFWPTGRQLMDLAGSASGRFAIGEGSFLLGQVRPFEYSWRCDVMGNLIAALTGLLDAGKTRRLFEYMWGVGISMPFPVRSIYPPIESGADDWRDYFIVNFLNLPHHYHNGGIWPFIGGLWVRFLQHVGRDELAHRELAALAEACRAGKHGEWEFNEWLHGQTGRPMGKAHQAWSAASYIRAYRSLRDRDVSPAFQDLDPAALS